ncbi:hypothetical protein AVEN_272286-2 [Araneus ventricosus]|uniref:Uncharacterized protein n=1 Tax=Araneus ventricosus TaxID=182803 RepID=A0A4Y2MIT3_ARAVE|nr:hypothetical protein AVEN_272286-2 [Araneus ventricosus]
MPYFNEPNDCRGWWTSRTGLEQKLIILSTILFIVTFSLTITVIVYKNRSSSGDCTTVAPPITGSTQVTGDTTLSTGASSSPSSDTTPAPETTPTTPAQETTPTTPAPETTPTTPAPETTPTTTKKEEAVPLEKSESSPLISLLKEANRVNRVLEKLKEEEKLRGA